MEGDEGTIPFLITPGAGVGKLYLRFPAEYEAEVRFLLDEHGLDHSTAQEFSADPTLWIEAVLLGAGVAGAGTAALARLASTIREVAHRHDGKRFILERRGEKVDVSGLSEKSFLRFLGKVADQKAQEDAEMQRQIAERTKDGSDPPDS